MNTKDKKTSIIFTGDMGFDRYMDKRWEDDQLLSKSILDYFESAEHVVANVEGALVDAADDGSRGACFHCMNPNATRVLKNIRADIWSIGNNHTMDAGVAGVISTKQYAKDMGCMTMGAGLNEMEASEPVYLDEAGGIGMFCVAYQTECVPATVTEPGIFRWDDFELIQKRIDEIKKKCRWCVIVSHGGEEFTSLPSPYTRERYLKFLEMGADVVVGHHPHVPENYELFDDGKMIFYSLGNFIFDTDYQRAHPYTDIGVLLNLIFTEEKIDFKAIGVRLIRGEERLITAKVPDVFTNISEAEYELLAPLSTKALVWEEKKRMIYLEPERFLNASEEVWNDYFSSEEPEGYVKNAHMDFGFLVRYAQKADDDSWKKSKLEKVKTYILHQFEDYSTYL